MMAEIPTIASESPQTPLKSMVSITELSFLAMIEEITGVLSAIMDSHKAKFLRGPLNLLCGDKAGILPPGSPIRREPPNEDIVMEVAA